MTNHHLCSGKQTCLTVTTCTQTSKAHAKHDFQKKLLCWRIFGLSTWCSSAVFNFLPTASENKHILLDSCVLAAIKILQNSIQSYLFSVCLNQCGWSQSLNQKDPMQHSPWKRRNHCRFASQIILQPPCVVWLEQTLNCQQLHPSDTALPHTATPPSKSLPSVVSSCSVTHCWSSASYFSDPGFVSMSEFVYKQDLSIVTFAYACPSAGMPQVYSCTKGKCLSALNKN